jgi:hypothetical protein
MRNVQLRIAALEKSLHGGELVLIMADGSERILALRGRDGVGYFVRNALQHPDGPEAVLIKSSVSEREPDGAAMVQLGRAILLSPSEDCATERNRE